jgi:hypothetical protein
MIYAQPQAAEPITQGDILDGCPIFGLDSADLQASPARWVERVIVLTQACDLAQTKTTKVLVALVHDAQKLVDAGILKSSTIRDQVRRGLVYGWYFLPAASDPMVLGESIVDLHDLHTVSRSILELLVANQQRVARLVPPYREHLSQHFALTYMRIGLPEPFQTA